MVCRMGTGTELQTTFTKLCVFVQTHGHARVHTAHVYAGGGSEVEELGKRSKGEIEQDG